MREKDFDSDADTLLSWKSEDDDAMDIDQLLDNLDTKSKHEPTTTSTFPTLNSVNGNQIKKARTSGLFIDLTDDPEPQLPQRDSPMSTGIPFEISDDSDDDARVKDVPMSTAIPFEISDDSDDDAGVKDVRPTARPSFNKYTLNAMPPYAPASSSRPSTNIAIQSLSSNSGLENLKPQYPPQRELTMEAFIEARNKYPGKYNGYGDFLRKTKKEAASGQKHTSPAPPSRNNPSPLPPTFPTAPTPALPSDNKLFQDYIRERRLHPHKYKGFQDFKRKYVSTMPVTVDTSRSSSSYHYEALRPEETKKQLQILLTNVQHTDRIKPPEERISTPPGMVCSLMEHQKLGVEWMLAMELGTNKGGILADDMGLGKTVQSIATILANPASDDVVNKATLVIAPLSLITQWEQEIRNKTTPPLKTLIYHGSNRKTSTKVLGAYDVVFTTYGTANSEYPSEKKKKKENDVKGKAKKQLSMDTFVVHDDNDSDTWGDTIDNQPKGALGPIFRTKWHRIILDEAHTIKNRNSQISKTVDHFDSTYRWCLTGTPIQNKLEELFPLLRFLAIKPYKEWDAFSNDIIRPFGKGRANQVMSRVQALLKAICLRRSKTSMLDGKKIIDLLPKTVNMDDLTFTEPEQDFYNSIFTRAQVKFSAYVRAGTVMKNYTSVLAWICRLRQACLNPKLVTFHDEKLAEAQKDMVIDDPYDGKTEKMRLRDEQLELIENMAEAVIERLKSVTGEENSIECPICMDGLKNGKLIIQCGHIVCGDCCTGLLEMEKPACAICRVDLSPKSVVPFMDFIKRHNSDVLEKIEADETIFDDIEVPTWEDDDQNVKYKEYDADFVNSTKIHKLLSLLRDSRKNRPGEKTIVFAQWVGFLNMVEVPLAAHGFHWARYDGTMSMAERQSNVDEFKENPDCNIMLISLKCGSLGLNLTCANRVVLMDVWWNPAVENQAIDRVHRLGQTKDVIVNRLLIHGSIEERILALQKSKQEISDSALGESTVRPQGAARLNIGDLMRLFMVDNTGEAHPENAA